MAGLQAKSICHGTRAINEGLALESSFRLSREATSNSGHAVPSIETISATHIPTKDVQIIVGQEGPFETINANRTKIVRVKIQNNTKSEIANGRLGIVNLYPANSGVSECELKSDITIGPNACPFIDIAYYRIRLSGLPDSPYIKFAVPMVGGFFAEAYTFANLTLNEHTFHLRFSRFTEIYDEIFCRLYLDVEHVLRLEEGLNPKSIVSIEQHIALGRDRKAEWRIESREFAIFADQTLRFPSLISQADCSGLFLTESQPRRERKIRWYQ